MRCEDCGREFEVPIILRGIKAVISRCPACGEKRDAEADAEETEREAAKKASRLAYARDHYPELALAAGIPPRLHGADIASLERDAGNAEAMDIAIRLLQSISGGFLYLTGEAGTGKTWIAAALCRARILALQPARFVRSNDLLNAIRAGFRSDGEAADPFKALPFLVIDDLGAESFTEWSVGYWYDLIDYRYNWLLPTVITSNLPLKDLKTKVSARVVSRIAESAMTVRLTGKDRRVK
jgi:DNA replication protein DnaC